jgi:hypothetical protein
MKVEDLKLYNKYKNINIPNRELIYIGISKDSYYYWFLFKSKNNELSIQQLNQYIFDLDKIVNDLNLETLTKYGNKYIKGYEMCFGSKEQIEKYIKTLLKNKLNNIINR